MAALKLPEIVTVADVRRFIFSFTAPATNRHARVTFKQLLGALDHPEAAVKAIHITGTNGKGSTTAMLYNGLLAAGKRVAAYLSPHVFDIRERWQVDGALVRDDVLITAARELAAKMPHINPAATDLTEFEVKTLLAFLIARRSNVDYHCIEVGIGGKFDATNVIPAPIAAIVTSIGTDHADVLGDSIRDIACHKVGIVKAGTGVVGIGPIFGEPRDIILNRAKHLALPIVEAENLEPLSTLLPGRPMGINAALALGVLRTILPSDVDENRVRTAVTRTLIPGRMQSLQLDGKLLIFDGAHNEAAAANLAATLSERYRGKHRVHGVVAHTGTHDAVAFARQLSPALNSVIVTVIPDRGQCPDAAEAAYLAAGLPVAVVDDPNMAVMHAIDGAGMGDIVLVTGSFYLAETIRMFLPAGWTPAISTMPV